MNDPEFVQRYDHFPPEVLKEQDGKTVPLTDKPGGRVIGEAKLTYNAEAEVLEAHFSVTDPKMAEFLKGSVLPFSIEKES